MSLTVYQSEKNYTQFQWLRTSKQNMKHLKYASSSSWHLTPQWSLIPVWQEARPTFKSVQKDFFHKLWLPHSWLFLKSISICFPGTYSYFSLPSEVWLFFRVVSGTALDIKHLNLKISSGISKKNVRTLILSPNAYYR